MTIAQPVILIDGSSFFFRAFHALPVLMNSKGLPTGAIFGVINMIRRLLKDYQPTHIAVIFDSAKKTFREELFPEYKAHRPPTPSALVEQFPLLCQIIEHMGIKLLMVDHVEADDVIATLSEQVTHEGGKVLIATSDKDLCQLVSENVTLINTMSNTLFDRAKVREKFGIAPEQIVDYLTLVGDSVDNIKGVPSVGPKTAAKWLQEYGSLNKLIENADCLSGKVGEQFRNSIQTLALTKELVTLKKDLKLPVALSDLKLAETHYPPLLNLYRKLEFKTLAQEAEQKYSAQANLSSIHEAQDDSFYELILTKEHFLEWIEKLKNADEFSLDTETTSLKAIEAKLVGIAFAIKGKAAYLPLHHDYSGAPQQLSQEMVFSFLKPLLSNEQNKIIFQNLKYDLAVFLNHDLRIKGRLFDTMLESYLLNSHIGKHDLDSLAFKYLHKKTIKFIEIAGEGSKQVTFNQIPLEQAGPYSAEDAEVTLALHGILFSKLEQEAGLKSVFYEIEMPLVPVLERMERVGVLIDAAQLKVQSEKLGEEIASIEAEVFKLVGEEFNLASPKQLQRILFDKFKLPILEKTPTGQASTSESVLQELSQNYPLPALILRHRSLSKLKSTYTDPLPGQMNPFTHRVHTSYQQSVTATGRLSSVEPNLQNIPVRLPEGRAIRKAFIAPSGYRIMSADYSQIELRIMAHMSADTGLLYAFSHGLDIHRATAAEIFSIPLNEVSEAERRSAKAINFGLIYGMSPFGLAKQLGIDKRVAEQYVNQYFERYPGVKRYMEMTRENAKKQGYVETLFGRRLYLPDLQAGQIMRRKAAERAAINAPMQGTAADIIKKAMISLDSLIQHHHYPARMILQVHDELVFEVKDSFCDEFTVLLREGMQNAAQLHVPLEVSIGSGLNWDEAH